ncbi:signal peptidase I [Microbacterium sp. NPDC056234]|uniref:signal peptidase I n=1 Tax=Microbacterium sp. NPDC056234 TaxID=3345757 RepID=UPI0035E29742
MTPATHRSPARRVRGILLGALLAIVCALALFTVVVPFLLGGQSYTVLTGSMHPALEQGHLIAVRPTPIADIRVGDVVTYQLHSGQPEVVTHRVVAVGVDGTGERILTTQGDANNVADAAPVREVQIRGILVYAIPWLGWINIWATPSVKSVVVAIIGILAIAWGVMALAGDVVRRRRLSATAAAAVAVVAALAGVLTAAPPAQATSAEASPLFLSHDGVTWTQDGTLRLLEGTRALIPGDTLDVPLWVRNASPDVAGARIETAWVPTDPASAADVELAEALTEAAPWRTERDLRAGASIQVPLRVALPAAGSNDLRDASAALEITVTLSQASAASDSPPAGGDTLPATGAEPPILALVGASVLILAGAVVLIVRRMRKGPRD